jgi:rhodanese-related sulfurtransferase
VIARSLRDALTLVALALAPALISGLVQLQFRPTETAGPGEVLVATARSWGEQVLYVDARHLGFDQGHIPNAVPLNEEHWKEMLPRFLDAWDPDRKVVVYCDGGACEASKEVADRLRQELQLKEVYVLKGGWPAWQRK